MSGSETFQGLSAKALEEHRQVHFFLDRLAESVDDLEAASDGLEPMRRVAAELDSLIERLAEHFQAEEKGGLFQGLIEILPEAEGPVRHLSDQHARILELLEMARIHARRAAPGDPASLCGDVRGFLDTMRLHEHAEEELLGRALEKDETRA